MTHEQFVTLTATDGHTFRAYTSAPDGAEPVDAIVLLHEIFGINKYMRTMAREFAEAGYLAIVPDLFARQEKDVELAYTGADFDHAIELRDNLDFALVLEDIAAAIGWTHAGERSTGRTGALGYCLGGGLAFMAARELDLDCAVSYYGVGVQDRIGLAEHIDIPVLFHFAEHDHYCPEPARELIRQAFRGRRNTEMYLYPGMGHAFATYERDSFDSLATKLAWERTMAFLDAYLASRSTVIR
ncbi:dienelactone hydrolase family protein [Arthrobacter sp. I2-34]|uniref:Dienelactone hydrolase family protein n=1 Tax=Arthrobacter hankyongi TaxID=2904801 RepID=A0ABS9L999_9MICC|nr:dienelactone hydrolase family protein [Arthrobacter hankyongi]MCG2623039.1 dienelactone hydrolase family protein [Arthrobacter hankyongi]